MAPKAGHKDDLTLHLPSEMPAMAFPAAVTLLNRRSAAQKTMFGYGIGSVQQRSSWCVLVPPAQKKGLRRCCTAFAATAATAGEMIHA